MSYTQLTREQRYHLYGLMKAGLNQTRIAANLVCHKSTISRELRRNRGEKGYRPYQADELAYGRQCELSFTYCLADLARGRAALASAMESGANLRALKAGAPTQR